MFHPLWLLAPLGAIVGLLGALRFYRQMRAEEAGEEGLRSFAEEVGEAARAYQRQQRRLVVSVLSAGFVLLLMLHFLGLQEAAVAPAFLLGGLCSALTGHLGLRTATQAAGRTARAAEKNGLDAALRMAYRSGAVMGLAVTGVALLFLSASLALLGTLMSAAPLRESAVMMVSFSMGASLQALLARIGGGVFSGAADLVADLHAPEKDEALTETDHRRLAELADQVGDHSSNVVGLSCDLFESYISSLLAATALGVTAMAAISPSDSAAQGRAAVLPLAVAGFGVLSSLLGVLSVRGTGSADPEHLLRALGRGAKIAAAFLLAGSAGLCHILFKGILLPNSLGWLGLWGCVALGLAAGLAMERSTQLFTSPIATATREIAAAAGRGPALAVIEGSATGALSICPPIVILALTILGSFILCGGMAQVNLGLFGVALTAVGMLSTLGISLANYAFGAVADGASGLARVSGLTEEARSRVWLLDSVGNITAAAGKSFAAGSAVLTTLALLAVYGEELKLGLIRESARQEQTLVWGVTRIDEVAARGAAYSDLIEWYQINLLNPLVLCGLLAGAAGCFAFCGLLLRSVGRTARGMLDDFGRSAEGLALDPTSFLAAAVKDAQLAIGPPAALALLLPLALSLLLGPAAVMGLVSGGAVTGFLLATSMANAGAAWDNAKRTVEGASESVALAAARAADSVGGPFKDSAGPSLNVLVKLMAVTAVVFAGVTVELAPQVAHAVGFF